MKLYAVLPKDIKVVEYCYFDINNHVKNGYRSVVLATNNIITSNYLGILKYGSEKFNIYTIYTMGNGYTDKNLAIGNRQVSHIKCYTIETFYIQKKENPIKINKIMFAKLALNTIESIPEIDKSIKKAIRQLKNYVEYGTKFINNIHLDALDNLDDIRIKEVCAYLISGVYAVNANNEIDSVKLILEALYGFDFIYKNVIDTITSEGGK